MKYLSFLICQFLCVFATCEAIETALPGTSSTLDSTPYLLPENHRLQPILKKIFSDASILKDDNSLKNAGFLFISAHNTSFVRVLTHPSLKGYILKTYVDAEPRRRTGFSGCDWLIRRCIGAEKIRELITQKQMKYFSVPDKWLFAVPNREKTYVLIAQKMNIYPKKETITAWKTKVTPKCLQELFLLMRLGIASKHLSVNVPFTKEGKFSFIDTEYPLKYSCLTAITQCLSPKMQICWEKIIENELQKAPE